VALLDIAGRIYAFIGLERTLASAVAVFDITSPYDVTFVDMIVTPSDKAPEGMAAYTYHGHHYLAISNETVNTAAGSTTLPARSPLFKTIDLASAVRTMCRHVETGRVDRLGCVRSLL